MIRSCVESIIYDGPIAARGLDLEVIQTAEVQGSLLGTSVKITHKHVQAPMQNSGTEHWMEAVMKGLPCPLFSRAAIYIT